MRKNGSYWNLVVSKFISSLCFFQCISNGFQITGCLFHVVVAASLEGLDKLSSTVFDDHNVFLSDRIVDSLSRVLGDFDVVFDIRRFRTR